MSESIGMHPEAGTVEFQLSREPRTPWRVAARCAFGHSTVIASPSRLDDGTPFPTLFWLTCPHIAEQVSSLESSGEVAAWAGRVANDEALAAALHAADAALREARAAESAGDDACSSVGIAGQRDPLGVKCLHAHVAMALSGIDDPIGAGVLATVSRDCDDDRCGSCGRGEASS